MKILSRPLPRQLGAGPVPLRARASRFHDHFDPPSFQKPFFFPERSVGVLQASDFLELILNSTFQSANPLPQSAFSTIRSDKMCLRAMVVFVNLRLCCALLLEERISVLPQCAAFIFKAYLCLFERADIIATPRQFKRHHFCSQIYKLHLFAFKGQEEFSILEEHETCVIINAYVHSRAIVKRKERLPTLFHKSAQGNIQCCVRNCVGCVCKYVSLIYKQSAFR
ncbi:hypothetical protein, conserved in T. vivax [Trypanosoma vivax Y486]|uniref:Uncharacterized protein n=1 Tax=Trypanosoma vivax (strain Y486) TaxID=1055687 RepID=F9WMU8_TRYVY|nr:hypothetical protein, conserved in T. vivax [Trypanosoma vivax Y486]|eukprot:CCD18863.1 hypothetical protein, conserved in T. vivax [Trypanosoma vivax Y486]